MDKATLLLLCVGLFCACDAYKILVAFPLPSKSHGILGEGVCRHLLNAGHEVTYLTPFPKNNTNPKFHQVDASEGLIMFEKMSGMLSLSKFVDGTAIPFSLLQNLIWFTGHMMASPTFELKKVQEFLQDQNQQFDAVIVEWLFSDTYTTFATVFDAPLIIVSSIEPHWMITSLIDEALNPAYNGYIVEAKPPFSFLDRAKEVSFFFLQNFLRQTAGRILSTMTYNKHIVPHIIARGRTPPSFVDILYNASLIIGNSHISMGEAKTLPQSYKAVGGYHIQENPPPLPADLKKIIDNAKNGVIYFSMGSNLKSKEFPEVVKKDLLKMFGTLKHTVLWKFEEKLDNLPSNVHILEWAPQQSILAHPNVILFITHGGLLSTTETIYAGKPIIGIPVFADQFSTVTRAVSKGFGKRVDLSFDMAVHLKMAIEDILADPNYAQKAKELSFIHHDRPVKPGVELVHWVEHVIKTGGAPHLRSPALMVPWYQKLYLDLAAVIVLIVIALRYLLRKIKNTFFAKKKKDNKKTN